MDPIGDPFQFSSSKEHKVEGVDDLLEEGWFFGNLLHRRNRMSRCYSDPCPSSNISQEMLVKNSIDKKSSSTKKLPNEGHHSLIRAPSLPSWIGREEVQDKENNTKMSKLTRQTSHQRPTQPTTLVKKEGIQESEARMSKLTGQSSRRSLLRTPSLPPCIGREEEIQDEESYARLSNLIRQALPHTSDILPPRHTSKCLMQSSSVPRNRPPRNLEVETTDTTTAKEMRPRHQNQRKLRRSSTDLEFEEVQGFKDLGFTFDKDDLTPSVVNILPGLQEKKNQEDLDQDKMRRPYLSEAWLVQRQSCSPPTPNCVPPIPNCVVKQSSAEDMKAQIKFWARAVASNVR